MDYNNNRLPGHSGPGGLLLSCGKKKQKIKNVFRTAKKPCTHRALKADDGNRTRVRKEVHASISGCSSPTGFPHRQAGKRAAASVASSVHGSKQSLMLLTCTAK